MRSTQWLGIARVRDYDSRAHGLDLEQQRPARAAKRDAANGLVGASGFAKGPLDEAGTPRTESLSKRRQWQ